MAGRSGTHLGILWLAAAILGAATGVLPFDSPLWGSLRASAQGLTVARYSITDLGTLGGLSSEASGINLLGEVAGSSTTASGVSRAFLYRNGRMIDLGTLIGGTESHGTAIADSGAVVGDSGINAYGPMFREFIQGFVWQDGAMRALGALYTPADFNVRHGTSRAFAVSNAGRVVGDSKTNRANFFHAFVWQANVMRDLIPEIDGASDSAAYGINDIDEIVGTIGGHAFLIHGDVRDDLGTLPGDTASDARAVNNKGQVAGNSTSGGGVSQALLWDLGTMRALGALPGDAASEARAINVAGDVVGRSGVGDLSVSRAVLWQRGSVLDLNTLTNASGWVLSIATGINDRGQIVGAGQRNGQLRGFLLDPQ